MAILALVAAFVAGCGSSSASSPIVPTVSPAASRTAQPGLAFRWPDGDRPAVSRELAATDEAYINPGAVIDQDGQLHMFANVFTAWPGRVEIRHLVSADGATWSLAEEAPAFTSDDVPFADPGADVSTGFVAEDGTWVLVFETVNQSGPWDIGVATAPGPDGPWTIAADPVLSSGPTGAVDSAGLPWPSVVTTNDGYAMYYTASQTGSRDGAIARAMSSDGRMWTKDPAPVFEAEPEWELGGLDRPRVVTTPDGYVMVYAGGDLTDRGVATSADGVTWERVGEAPAITALDFPVSGRSWDAALVVRDGELVYYLEIGTATAGVGTEIYRATTELP
jgi:predicted GH43/DUF377 family glycosyl hydrolase